jgi:hypothetical protein
MQVSVPCVKPLMSEVYVNLMMELYMTIILSIIHHPDIFPQHKK